MKACQAELPSPKLPFDVERFLHQTLDNPVAEAGWWETEHQDACKGISETVSTSFLECRAADNWTSSKGMEKCHSSSKISSWCDSGGTESILQEDFSLSHDDDGPFSEPSSGEEMDDDSDMYEFLFGVPTTLEQQPFNDSTPEWSEESQKTSQSSLNELSELEDEDSAAIKPDSERNGTRLVHLLLAAAEAVESCNQDLASVILERLKELSSYSGSSIQRIAAYFCDGLQCRIDGIRPSDWASKFAVSSRDQYLAAFQVLHELSPYTKFGYFTANQAILEAIQGEPRVNIVDYEIADGVQWSSLMQSLASSKEAPPHLRITAVHRPHIKRRMASIQETGRRLSEFAASLNISFSFNIIRLDKEEEFRPSALKILKGEALVVNCMLHLPHMPHRTASSVSSFLQGIRQLSPLIVTLVEEELGYGTASFTNNFVQALHHYSAIFDSIAASCLAHPDARSHIERILLAPRLMSMLTTSCSDNSSVAENGLGRRNWRLLLSSAGFDPVALSAHNRCQARLMQGLFSEGFQIADGTDFVRLGWCSNPLFTATLWKCR